LAAGTSALAALISDYIQVEKPYTIADEHSLHQNKMTPPHCALIDQFLI
jgi:hypothetical protein